MTDSGIGDIDDFHAFREKKYNFLYLCNTCARSFDSILSMSECKFCSSPVKELSARQNHPLIGESYFRYYCSKCEKNFLSPVKHDECQICGFRIVHFYKWQDMPLKDKLMAGLFKKVDFNKAPVAAKTKEEPKKLAVLKLPGFAAILSKLKSVRMEEPKPLQEELPTF